MTIVKIVVVSPMGDVEVEQRDPVQQFGTDTDFNRAKVAKTLAKAIAQIHAAYGIEESS